MKELRGKNALLTGAAGGLGAYIARALAAQGVNLVLSDLIEGSLDERLEEARRGGVRAEALYTDLSAREQAADLPARAEAALGPIDILVNNAGLEFAGPLSEREPREIEALLDVNLLATVLTTRACLPGMLERGGGHVVNIASMAGKASFPYLSIYCASKHGVVGFSHALRAELGGGPVGVSAICPGLISGAGMYGRLEQEVGPPPGPLSPLPPERVGEAVVRAIRDDRPEVIVNRPGARPLIFLAALAPGAAAWFGRRRQLREFAERFSNVKRRAPATAGERHAAQGD